MKKYLLTLALMAMTAFSVTTLRADDTNAPAAATDTAVAAATNAAPATPAPLPAASLDQRISTLEAYIENGDPTAPLKDTNGNIWCKLPIMSSLVNSTGSAQSISRSRP